MTVPRAGSFIIFFVTLYAHAYHVMRWMGGRPGGLVGEVVTSKLRGFRGSNPGGGAIFLPRSKNREFFCSLSFFWERVDKYHGAESFVHT